MRMIKDPVDTFPDQVTMSIRVAIRLLQSERVELRHWGRALAFDLGTQHARDIAMFLTEIDRRTKEK